MAYKIYYTTNDTSSTSYHGSGTQILYYHYRNVFLVNGGIEVEIHEGNRVTSRFLLKFEKLLQVCDVIHESL